MFEPPSGELRFQNSLPDWVLRFGIFLAFLLFGAEKFKSGADAPWVALFKQIGFGQWFRYFTGTVELVGAFLVLIPNTVTVGVAMLACTMGSAVLIIIAVLHRPADALLSFALGCALVAFWMHRRRV